MTIIFSQISFGAGTGKFQQHCCSRLLSTQAAISPSDPGFVEGGWRVKLSRGSAVSPLFPCCCVKYERGDRKYNKNERMHTTTPLIVWRRRWSCLKTCTYCRIAADHLNRLYTVMLWVLDNLFFLLMELSKWSGEDFLQYTEHGPLIGKFDAS